MPSEEVEIRGEKLTLFPEKGALWSRKSTLLLADLHLGKVNHFRKSGIAVPEKANDQNTEKLIDILQLTKPERVIFMGDLFHSHYNLEWEVFGQVINHFTEVSFELVQGNHDIMSSYQYDKHRLKLHNKPLVESPFILSHEPMEEIPDDLYNIAGHVHPGVRLLGKGRQGLRLPCFYFSKNQALLPAFGAFTGMYRISPKKEDSVYLIVENSVIKAE
ncbi:MAG: ligase-associated DNA damage response endonuclease PdeM [Bacteroidota bacterium]